MLEQYTITGTITTAGDINPDGIRIQAFDRDLPSLEIRKGTSPPLLGEGLADAKGRFSISYQFERFHRADLSFSIFDQGGTALCIKGMEALKRSFKPDQIIFNVPGQVEVQIFLEPRLQTGDSEFAQVMNQIRPIIAELSLTELTDSDIDFLINELDAALGGKLQQQVEWLRRSSLLARETGIPAEAFYGWGRKEIPAPFSALWQTPLKETPSLLKKLSALENKALQQALLDAGKEKIIPSTVADRWGDLSIEIERLKVGQGALVSRRFVGKLLDESNGEPLVGVAVRGFDPTGDPAPKALGQDVTNNNGLFSLPLLSAPKTKSAPGKLLLHIFLHPQKAEEKIEIEVPASENEEIVSIPIPRPGPAPAGRNITQLAANQQLKLPPSLIAFLPDKQPGAPDNIRSSGSNALTNLQNDYSSLLAIANTSRPEFVNALHEPVGDYQAAKLQVVARAQTQFLDNVLAARAADRANGFTLNGMAAELDDGKDDVSRAPHCTCNDCEAAVSPLAYLADLLKYTTQQVKNGEVPVSVIDLAKLFRQPFDALPASCEAADVQLRQVRICVEVLRLYLGVRPLADTVKETTLAGSEKTYRLAAYSQLLNLIGTSYAELRLARTGPASLRQALGERLGIDEKHLDELFLDTSMAPDPLSEQQLELLFGLTDTNRPILTAPEGDPLLQTWRLAYLRTLWKKQDFPPDIYEAGQIPLIDPDLVGPDDFCKPFPGDPDKVFDTWKKRRDWVDGRLQAFQGLSRIIPGQAEATPDIAAMFAAMYQTVSYGADNIQAWANTCPVTEFGALQVKLATGTDVDAASLRIKDELNLTVNSFTRLMTIRDKDKTWESDTRNEKVTAEEWREVYSILVQAQKVKLSLIWRNEETGAGIQADGRLFWISLSEPQEGAWPPVLAAQQPLIDPDILKPADLPSPLVGEKAIAFWHARKALLDAITGKLDEIRLLNGFDDMLRWAIGHPYPGDPLQHDLDLIKTDLSSQDPGKVKAAVQLIENDLHLSLQGFKQLITVRDKNAAGAPEKPTAAEWKELYTNLTAARKIKHEIPIWLAEEAKPATGVLYWNALKAKLPRWRSSADARQSWQQMLRNRCRTPIIDPDIIGPADFRNPAAGDPAFDCWQSRDGELEAMLTHLKTAPLTLAGLDTLLQEIPGVSAAALLNIGDSQEKGHVISDRLAQLCLENAAFNYLLRIGRLLQALQPVLDIEWENLYAILIQVWKRKNAARWREEERSLKILASPDFFRITASPLPGIAIATVSIADTWRAPAMVRREWQDKLQSRFDQEGNVIRSLQDTVSATEEATLPSLRDALIIAADPLNTGLDERAHWLTENLLIDMKMSGCTFTTRAAQAIETLQGLILALRTSQMEDTFAMLTLNTDSYEEEWKWMGSYATWRAAMFCFLYSENILQPSLRSSKTPAFKTLLNNTPASRSLTPEDACREAYAYARYFQDVCTLRVEASCTSNTRLFKTDGCSRTDNGYRCLFYMFGRGAASGQVYWSSYDDQTGPGYSQTFWSPVAAGNGAPIKNWDNIINVVGAVPYQVISGQRFIFLFARKLKDGAHNLVCAKYDLENQYWQEEALALPVPLTSFTVAVKQQDIETEAPAVLFAGPGGFLYEQQLKTDGLGWISDQPKELLVSVAGVAGLVGTIEPPDKPFYLICYTDNYNGTKNLECLRFQSINHQIERFDLRYPFPIGTSGYKWVSRVSFGEQIYLGAFSWPGSMELYGTNDIYVATNSAVSALTLWLVQDTGGPVLSARPVNHPFSLTWPYVIAPTAGLVNPFEKAKFFAYQGDQYPAMSDKFRRLTIEGDLYSRSPFAMMPSVTGPYNIPGQLSAADLQLRKGLIQTAFVNNQATSPVNLTYLEEAYYAVPVQLALTLQRSGAYINALDWLRTVYDYTAPESLRKIYYGLVAEESLAVTYKRAPNWLLDPLNPHAIAATRRNTYTRFTLLSIIQCLLDYADAEFTADTPESIPRARRMYLAALELLETTELKQQLAGCESIIGTLDDVALTDVRWMGVLKELKGELSVIAEPLKLQQVVSQVRQKLLEDAPLERRFSGAREIIRQAQAETPAVRTLMAVMEEEKILRHKAEQSALLDSTLAAGLQAIGDTAAIHFERTLSMVTGISSAQLEREPSALSWLREPIAQTSKTRAGQASALLTFARRDLAKADALSPTYISDVAQVVATQPMNAVMAFNPARNAVLPSLITAFCIPPNPVLNILRQRATLNLQKLRSCRNIAGLKRQVEPYAAATDSTSGMPVIGAGGQLVLPGVANLRPTLYRYEVLIERAKQLVQLAAQIESAMLSALEKRDAEAYTALKARQELDLARAGIQLQNLRLTEADNSVKLSELQKQRSVVQANKYREFIESGINKYEQDIISAYIDLETIENEIAAFDSFIQISQAMVSAAGAGVGAGAAFASAAILSLAATSRTSSMMNKFAAETKAQVARVYADYENRKREWELAQLLATEDMAIGDQQIVLAKDQVEIVKQEKIIAELQSSNARDTIEFLATKFTNVNLYDWMSGILEGVYRFFLQQATAMAKLAQTQLAFVRQELSPAYIQASYWALAADGASNNGTGNAPDRKGLTGAARLLQDIYQLDQYAFSTNLRKLQIVKTFSLSRLSPFEFQRFRETGVMVFLTPMVLFDRDFPGHYLRLIHRVRTAVIALIPPTEGIHATLTATGLSRVVIGPDIFQTMLIRRDPESVALSAPANATGLFEMDPQQTEMLLPFEGSGVDTTWELRMPKASNQFDYSTIADVLITFEYTALNSFDYRQQVIQTLNPNLSADRPFSFRNQFADQWYDLHNPAQTKTPMTIRFRTIREDFPPNIETLKIQQVLLYFVRADSNSPEIPVSHLRYTAQGEAGAAGGGANSIDGFISTQRGNAGSWTSMIGKPAAGDWELALPDTEEMRARFQQEEIKDILFVITYSGRTPAWPA
jgi:hypothetical protein